MDTVNDHVPGQDYQVIELQEAREELNEDDDEAKSKDPLKPEESTKSKESIWRPCRQEVFWKCKLWMLILAVFLVIILLITFSLILYSEVYTDEDEYWDPDLVSHGNHHNFSGTLKVRCSAGTAYSEDLTKKLTDVYNSSPALGRYFVSAHVVSFSDENATAFYQLLFSLPPVTEEFMKYTMSKEFVMNVLRQNILDEEDSYDKGASDCTKIRLDPDSLTLT
ncbi:PREDICTED: TPA-induced transmembrane protein [Gavialis gangeticus]|uniref:TPA-induced transmembrane protein n=1 Tax=Gavialis gangeticus TaxID=94835 RepID=UPI00092EEE86|nr:PREDICTED: TPA-induced transmembrane protein [Gavialis gangeticus]XP_019381298.1 PREDICTED: TPA-induced transmembrane protein [Gavialis gangeticus]XP_019381299.1 PREDICTED: TPA-induced transmembrane protein [Gavialis gangeticus]XP_019381300.1 PREDICTED: TPA-induced transmembrane protein [Gavialis gangeticus]XP_019381301.1 PREDICTED: TPA-induced transmembrane protein [Gavialis gangeticus]